MFLIIFQASQIDEFIQIIINLFKSYNGYCFVDTIGKMIYDLVVAGCGSDGRALRSGRRGRVFESRHSEKKVGMHQGCVPTFFFKQNQRNLERYQLFLSWYSSLNFQYIYNLEF